jgi:hypothetical protein
MEHNRGLLLTRKEQAMILHLIRYTINEQLDLSETERMPYLDLALPEWNEIISQFEKQLEPRS